MAMFYCMSCDKYFDSDTQDHANYDGEWPKCESCVDDEKELRREHLKAVFNVIDEVQK